jgi:hypothetical protein
MLWNAIKNNNLYNISVIVNANFPLETPLNALGMNALHFACCSASGEAVDFLIKSGCSWQRRDNVSSFTEL